MIKINWKINLAIGLFVFLSLLFDTHVSISKAQIPITPTASPTVPILPTPYYYTVVQGETLDILAFKFGITVDQLLVANPGVNAGNFSVGMLLRIPPEAKLPAVGPTPLPVSTEQMMGGAPIAPPTPTPLPEINTYKNTARITFKDLGEATFLLQYPSSNDISMNLPDIWSVQYSMSFLDLHYDLYDNRLAQGQLPQANYGQSLFEAPVAEVFINGYFAGAFTPELGNDHYVRLYLPSSLIEEKQYNLTNEYTITIQYYKDNAAYCNYGGTITIHDDSSINLMFGASPPYLNLANFPSPVVLCSFIPETLPIIIPDQFTESDLSAAANVAATIGRKATGNVTLKVITASEATAQLLSASNAIAIGQPERNAFIKQLYNKQLLPTSFSLQGTISDNTGAPIAPDSGLLQLVRSDFNNIFSFLVITGGSDKAIERAANAIVNPPIGMNGVAYINNIDLISPMVEEATVDTFRLSDLGYRERVFFGLTRYLAVSPRATAIIYIPRNWVIKDNAYLAVNYDFSSNLTLKNSGINVYLNGTLIGSVPLELKPGEKQAVIPIKADAFILGSMNIFRFEAILQAPLECTAYDIQAYWMRISNTSFLKVPHLILNPDQSLAPFTQPLLYLPFSHNVIVSLPPIPTQDEMSGMLNITKVIGTFIQNPYYNFKVSLNPGLDPVKDITTDLIVIGKPSRNPLIARVNDKLPQPFVLGEDNLTIKQDIGAYRIQQDTGIGMIQVMPAPRDALLGITVITGTTDNGFEWAIDRASNPVYVYDFVGDLSFIQDNRIDTFQTTRLFVQPIDILLSQMTEQQTTVMPLTPGITATSGVPLDKYVSPSAKTGGEKSPLLTYLIVGLVVLALAGLVFALIRTARGGGRK